MAAGYVYIVTFPRRLQICLLSANLRIYRQSDLHRSAFLYLPLFRTRANLPVVNLPVASVSSLDLASPFSQTVTCPAGLPRPAPYAYNTYIRPAYASGPSPQRPALAELHSGKAGCHWAFWIRRAPWGLPGPGLFNLRPLSPRAASAARGEARPYSAYPGERDRAGVPPQRE